MSLTSKIEFEVGDAKSAIDSLDQTLAQYGFTVDDVAKATRTLNTNQETTSVTLKLVNKEGKVLTAVFDDFKQGVAQTTLKFRQFNEVAKDTAAATKKAQAAGAAFAKQMLQIGQAIHKANVEQAHQNVLAQRYADATASVQRLAQPYQGQIQSASPEKALQLARAMDTVRQSIVKGRFSVTEFETAFANLQRNGASSLVGLDKGLAGAVFNLNRSFTTLGDAGERSGQRVLLTWAGVARLFIVQQLHRFIGLVSNEFVRATKASIDYSNKIAELQTVSLSTGTTFNQWSKEVRQLSDAFAQQNTVVAEAIYEGLSNQVITAGKSTQFLQQTLILATATVSSANDAVNIMSSAINSFNLSTADSNRIAGVFFKTVELGRVRLTEMANDFGTIGPLAAKLGIEFEEVNAIISSLTRTGIKYNEVNTIISSIMNELLKPSDELQALFDRLGVTSGEAAIKTFGFAGFMRILNKESEQGVGHMAGLFNNVRALRGIVGTTGDGISQFENDLKQLRENGVDNLSEAFDKIAGTDARKLQVEFNKLKNFFEVDLGVAFQSTAVNLIDSFGGLINAFQGAVFAVTGLSAAFVTQRVLTNLVNADIIGLIANTVRMTYAQITGTTATNAYAAAQLRLGTILRSTNVWVAAATIAIGVLSAMWVDSTVAAAEFEQKISELNQTVIEASKSQVEEAQKAIELQSKAITEGLEKQSQIYLQYTARVIQVSDSVVTAVREKSKAAADAFKAYVDGISDRIRDAAQKAVSEVERLKRLKEDAEKNVQNIEVQAAKEKVERQIEVEQDPNAKAAILQAEMAKIDRRLNEIQKLGANATEKELAEARAIAELREQYAKRLHDLRLQQEQALAKEEDKLKANLLKKEEAALAEQIQALENKIRENKAKGKGNFDEDDVIRLERQKRELEAKQKAVAEARKAVEDNAARQAGIDGERRAAEAEIENSVQRRLQLEKQINAIYAERAELAEKAANAKKVADLNFETAAKGFTAQTDKERKIEFNASETDPVKLRESLDAQEAALSERLEKRKEVLLQAARDSGIVGDQLKALERNVEAEITRVKEEANAVRLAAEARANQQILINAETEAKKRLAQAEKEAREQVAINETAEDAVIASYEAFVARLRETLTQAMNPEDRKKLTEALETALITLAKLKDLDANNTLAANANEATAALGDLLQKINEVQQNEAQGVSFEATQKALDALRANIIGISEAAIGLDAVDLNNQNVEAGLLRAQKAAQAFADALQAAVPAAFDANANVQNLVNNTANNLPPLLERMKELVRLLNAAAAVQGVPGIPRAFGGHMQYLAQGGRGMDTIPAMLSPGEYVMNRNTTQKYYTQLVAMNQGRQPRSFSQGGNVTTVGDINVTVQGGSTARETVSDIARQLKRRIRLGKL